MRLILRIAPAVAKAAAESRRGHPARSPTSMPTASAGRFVYQTGMVMRPVFAAARRKPARVAYYAEGEDERVLRAGAGGARGRPGAPILVGRPAVIAMRIERAGLTIKAGVDFEICDPEHDPRFRSYWEQYRS